MGLGGQAKVANFHDPILDKNIAGETKSQKWETSPRVTLA